MIINWVVTFRREKGYRRPMEKRLVAQTSMTLKPYGIRTKWWPPFSISAFDMQYTTPLISVKAAWAFIWPFPSTSEILSHSGSITSIANLRPSAGSWTLVPKNESQNPGWLKIASSYWCHVAARMKRWKIVNPCLKSFCEISFSLVYVNSANSMVQTSWRQGKYYHHNC